MRLDILGLDILGTTQHHLVTTKIMDLSPPSQARLKKNTVAEMGPLQGARGVFSKLVCANKNMVAIVMAVGYLSSALGRPFVF